ncbi:hypothetical protein AVEN_173508-1 [Araneus ventricosus]|uniref:Uncharacterized protein n=1 Tax=Araneus ventricosus TaxID=182803 RepID=A0A4Y2MB90_ARAVE|nr:hypothetical protein AVEN_173508-1 [Araneus ventricosus]
MRNNIITNDVKVELFQMILCSKYPPVNNMHLLVLKSHVHVPEGLYKSILYLSHFLHHTEVIKRYCPVRNPLVLHPIACKANSLKALCLDIIIMHLMSDQWPETTTLDDLLPGKGYK